MLVFLISLIISCNFASVKIGAKKFTEGNILAHLMAFEINEIDNNIETIVLENLGGSGVITNALLSKEIDFYVDYDGTLFAEFGVSNIKELELLLLKKGLVIGSYLGFDNSYALAVQENSKLIDISDISNKNKLGISHEFSKRKDGLNALLVKYNINPSLKIMEHSLMYGAIDSKQLDIMEVYTTDAKLNKMNLRVLNDKLNFFTKYNALLVYSKDFTTKYPQLFKKLDFNVKNKYSTSLIQKLNYNVEERNLSYFESAQTLFKDSLYVHESDSLLKLLFEHLQYLVITVVFCIIIGVPLGFMAYQNKIMSIIILNTISVLQTIPSLALLVLIIPLTGLGQITTLICLVSYGLLPIVKNTYEALKITPIELIEYSQIIGMSKKQRLLLLELPLAKRQIFTGIKICAVYTIGITVIAAFIGAGALGSFIVTGLSLNDMNLILKGAIPSACLAILVELVFSIVSKRL